MESGLRPASSQLENRQRRFGLRLLSLPQGDKAREVIGGAGTTTIGKRLKTALNHTWTSTEQTVLREDPESLDADLIEEDRAEAKKEAEKERPGLVMYTDGSRLESEAAGYAVAWMDGQTWEGIKTHMGYNQEAYDEKCAALAHALETAARSVHHGPRHHIHRHPDGDPEDGFRGARTGTEIHTAGKRTRRRAMEIGARHHYRAQMVPGT